MDNNTEKTNLDPMIFYLFLFLCTGEISVISVVFIKTLHRKRDKRTSGFIVL